MPHSNGDITAAESYYRDFPPIPDEALSHALPDMMDVHKQALIDNVSAYTSQGEWWRQQRRAQDERRHANSEPQQWAG